MNLFLTNGIKDPVRPAVCGAKLKKSNNVLLNQTKE